MTAKIAILKTSVGVHPFQWQSSFSAWEANFCAGTARDWDIGLVSIIILTDDIAPSLFRRARGGVWEEVVIIDNRAEAIFIALSGFRAF